MVPLISEVPTPTTVEYSETNDATSIEFKPDEKDGDNLIELEDKNIDIDHGTTELDLPDHDFSKLLEFNSKSDDALLSAANDLLNYENDDNEIIHEDYENRHEGHSKGDDKIDDEEQHMSVDPLSNSSSDEKNDNESEHKDDMEGENEPQEEVDNTEPQKEETSNHLLEVNLPDAVMNDIKESGNLIEAATNNEDRASPQSIINEKNNLFNRQRQNSLTPIMFPQSKLPISSNFITADYNAKKSNSGDSEVTKDINGQVPSELEEQPTVSAYARLDFQSFTFYVQTLHVIIGRRSENEFTHKVDVNLGPSKSISRRHAQIFYNFGTGRFELSVIGKNGAFIDDVFIERGNTVPLKNMTKIQVGQIPFQFILPDQDKKKKSDSEGSAVTPQAQTKKAPEKKAKSTTTKTKKAKKEPSSDKDKVSVNKEPAAKKAKPKTPAVKEKKPAKPPKKVYTINEIPPEYRNKPLQSYSTLLTTCIRKYTTPKGMSLSEIYSGIKELFPYYKYCPDGWQSSVRHNLSLNKSFRKVSKEGKGWLWGLDEKHIAEREQQKKKQAAAAAAKAEAAQLRLTQQQHRTKKGGSVGRSDGNGASKNGVNAKSQQNISETLAANRSTNTGNKADDHQRTMKYLQDQLITLTKDRKGLTKPVIASILTQALAMTINQVTQAAKSKGITGNPLTALMDKNPQHLNLILAAAVNAATTKVTNGKVKQLVAMPTNTKLEDAKSSKPSPQAEPQAPTKAVSPVPMEEVKQDEEKNETNHIDTPLENKDVSMDKEEVKEEHETKENFDLTSLSKFFQPRQPSRASSVVPQKRSRSNEEDEDEDDDDDDDDEDEEDGEDEEDEEENSSSATEDSNSDETSSDGEDGESSSDSEGSETDNNNNSNNNNDDNNIKSNESEDENTEQ